MPLLFNLRLPEGARAWSAWCLLASSVPAWAAPDAPDPARWAECAAIGPAADRLSCYDKLAGRAPSAPVPASSAEAQATVPAPTSLLAPKDTPLAAASPQQRRTDPSLLSTYWELESQDKRGTFNLTGYRPNYALPVHLTSRINRAPQSPTQAVVPTPAYRDVEAKFQLSFRTKAVQDIGFDNADLWFAFTQQTMWQVWNGEDSKPFRNTDYEPELMYVVPVPSSFQALPQGWKWRYAQFGLAHQSNGQSDPLSRSWNRVYLGSGFERGDWTLSARVARRLSENPSTDNNPDLVSYRGRGELQATWSPGVSTASVLYRSTLRDTQFGALQLEWTYPVFQNQPNGVRYFLQLYHGYGETLTDYNFRQTSLGLGLSFLQF
ncbi:MAG: phospholipase A [Pseudomonadota bacterium]